MQLTLLGTTVKKIVGYGANLYHFTEAGLDVHTQAEGTRLAWASLANVTCGAVNDNGIYLGTSAAGVYFLPHSSVSTGGDRTADLVQQLTTTSTPALLSNAVTGLVGRGTKLLATTGGGVNYLPDTLTVYKYTDVAGCSAPAISTTAIAYVASDGIAYTKAYPSADWATATGVPLATNPFLSFDGVDDNVNCGDVLDMGLSDRTYEIWLRTTQSVSSFCLSKSISKVEPCRWGLAPVFDNGKPLFFSNFVNVDILTEATTAVNDGAWHHLAVTIDRSANITLYVDGVAEAVTDISAHAAVDFQSANFFRIGAYTGSTVSSTTWLFDGDISEVRVWDMALSPTDIQNNMYATLTGSEPGLLALYNFEDTGSTLTDSAGTNDGLITGGTWGNEPVPPEAINDLSYGGDLFAATDDGVIVWDGFSSKTLTTELGTVQNVVAIHPGSTATKTTGYLAYGTSDGVDGGQFGVLNMAEVP
ncbi:MAG: LamG domain-containing protein [Desulfuromonadales bacterium]|nr:LamG domain-containing protein [Desulfuromonadales bacterium]